MKWQKLEASYLLRLITYAITSAISCEVNLPSSPNAGILFLGSGPSGSEPCSIKLSRVREHFRVVLAHLFVHRIQRGDCSFR